MPYNCGLLSGFGAIALQSPVQCLELKWEEEAEGYVDHRKINYNTFDSVKRIYFVLVCIDYMLL